MRDIVRAVSRRLRAARASLILALVGACAGDDEADTGASESGATTSGGTTGAASGATTTSGGASESGTTGTGTDTSAGTSAATTSTGGDTDTTTGGALDDEAILRMAIAGEIDPADALATVADSGGLPVLTKDGTFLFACLCGPGGWSLIGDHNAWAPAPMGQSGPLWWIEADVPAPDGSRYKFKPDAGDDVADPYGRRYSYDQFGEISFVRASAPHLERWYAYAGFGLGPRDLQVWVPQDGAFTHMLFAHDGQNLFDPAGIGGGWKLQKVVPPEMLIVGIDNTGVARMDEYTHVEDDIGGGELYGGKGDAYADLVEMTIRPRMEAAYGEAAVVGTMGSSLGGLIAFHIGHRFPERYDMVISLSGTMGWGSIGLQNPTMMELYEGAGKRPFAVYLDSGGSDGGSPCVDADADGTMDDDPDASDNYCENLQMRDLLESLGWAFDVDLWHWWEQGAPHNEVAWAARVDYPLGLFADL